MHLSKSKAVVPTLRFEQTVDSTNATLLREHANLTDFSVLVAAEQVSGQGRAGRSWVSEPGASLSISVLLRPKDPAKANLITLLAAASLHQGLSHLYQQTDLSIKWPNDILKGEKKLAGILAQLNPDGSVVCGVGVNLLPQQQAPETAVAVSEFADPDFDEISSSFLSSLRLNWERLQSTEHPSWLLEYARNNCSTLGMLVRADLVSGESITGKATSITDDGRLVISNDTEHIVSAADLWHIRKT